MSFTRSLSRAALFLIPELLFLILRFVVWGDLVSKHSLMPLVVTTIGIVDNVSISVCGVSAEFFHDNYHGSCYGGLKCSGVYL